MLHSELEAQRKGLHLSQSEMADRLGVSRHTYMRWENGKTAKLPADLAARISNGIAGKVAELQDRGEDLLEVTRHTHPKWYTKVSSRGVYIKSDSHPGPGRIQRKYLDAYKRGDMTTWNAYLASLSHTPEPLAPAQARAFDIKPAPQPTFPTLAEAMGQYETTGEDDLSTEKRLNAFFSNPT